jgi:hypothetical protein
MSFASGMCTLPWKDSVVLLQYNILDSTCMFTVIPLVRSKYHRTVPVRGGVTSDAV